MTRVHAYLLVAALACVLGAAFSSAAQAALTRMTLTRARKLEGQGRRGAGRLVRLMQNPPRTLEIVAFLLVFLEVTAAALLTFVVSRYLMGGLAVAVAALTAAAALFVGAEVAPKTLAVRDPERVALVTAPWIRLLSVPLAPLAALLVWIGDLIAPGSRLASGPFVTADELRDMIDVAESDEVIEASERAMLHRVIELSDTVVREIMVPRPDMVTVSADDALDDVLDVILRAGHSRVPVHSVDRDEIVGLIYAKDVLGRLHRARSMEGPWDDLLRAPHFVPELATVDQLLRDMQAQQVHLAVVVDEYGGIAGLVTIEDILEEIVGEIVDEYDREEPLVEELTGDRWRIDARLPVERLNELLDARLPDDEWDSVGGLLYGVLGRIPAVGETIDVAPVRLTAERVKGRRIAQVLVERLPAEATAAAAAEAGRR